MLIAIISDAHDHRGNLYACFDDLKQRKVDHILHLGDYGAPGLSVKPLVSLGIPVTGIRGNNDGEKRGVATLFARAEHCEIRNTVYGTVELDGKKIFMVHYDTLHEIVAKSGMFDLVCYGHNHIRNIYIEGKTTVCNPGAICGNKESRSYALYDTTTNSVEHVEF